VDEKAFIQDNGMWSTRPSFGIMECTLKQVMQFMFIGFH
jgi:hypothetical protein